MCVVYRRAVRLTNFPSSLALLHVGWPCNDAISKKKISSIAIFLGVSYVASGSADLMSLRSVHTCRCMHVRVHLSAVYSSLEACAI